jgi:predicted metal-dependent peptidase
VRGRGGTDLRPPLDRHFLRKHRPDLVVYFTDGDGPAPDKPPGPALIWCLVPGGRKPAVWGRVLHMQEET